MGEVRQTCAEHRFASLLLISAFVACNAPEREPVGRDAEGRPVYSLDECVEHLPVEQMCESRGDWEGFRQLSTGIESVDARCHEWGFAFGVLRFDCDDAVDIYVGDEFGGELFSYDATTEDLVDYHYATDILLSDVCPAPNLLSTFRCENYCTLCGWGSHGAAPCDPEVAGDPFDRCLQAVGSRSDACPCACEKCFPLTPLEGSETEELERAFFEKCIEEECPLCESVDAGG